MTKRKTKRKITKSGGSDVSAATDVTAVAQAAVITNSSPTSDLLVSDIRRLFETSADASVVRDCVRALGAAVLKSETKDYQRTKAADRLVVSHNGSSPRVITTHRDFIIASVEFHQPFFIDGMFIHSGYLVCSEDDRINVMPGACWFITIAEAKRGIDCLIEAGGAPRPPYQKDDGVGRRFWKLMEAMRTRSP